MSVNEVSRVPVNVYFEDGVRWVFVSILGCACGSGKKGALPHDQSVMVCRRAFPTNMIVAPGAMCRRPGLLPSLTLSKSDA